MKLVILFIFSVSVYAQSSFFQDPSTGLISDQSDHNLAQVLDYKNSSSILWWNILGKNNSLKYDGKSVLIENIQSLLKVSTPEIFILGEFFPGNTGGKRILKILKNKYRFVRTLKYSNTEVYFIIATDYPFRIASNKHLKWYQNLEQKKSWEGVCKLVDGGECRYFYRRYIRLEFMLSQFKKLNLFPIHLNQPWNPLKKYLNNNGSSNLGSKPKLVTTLMVNGKNPNYWQAKNYIRELKNDLVSGEGLFIGDFNSPKNIYGIPLLKSAYHIFNNNFFSLVRKGASFPSAYFAKKESFSSFPPVLIDHAFSTQNFSEQVKHSSIVEMAGSDHYPLMIWLN